jgi:hypothetical protein
MLIPAADTCEHPEVRVNVVVHFDDALVVVEAMNGLTEGNKHSDEICRTAIVINLMQAL